MIFTCLLLASNVQRWIRDVQKCSSLTQLWPEISKLKSAGSALNIAENAKISESVLKMVEYLWELNPGSNYRMLSISLSTKLIWYKGDRSAISANIMTAGAYFSIQINDGNKTLRKERKTSKLPKYCSWKTPQIIFWHLDVNMPSGRFFDRPQYFHFF